MKISEYLSKNNLSAGDFAKMILRETGYNVNRATLTRLIAGQVRNPSVHLAIAIEHTTDGDVRVWEVAMRPGEPAEADALSH